MSVRGLFVTGTDTGVGKTFIAASIARLLVADGCRVGVLKPVATGALRRGSGWMCDDAEVLASAVGGDVPRERVVPRVYEEPLAPAVAARRTGTPLCWGDVSESVAGALAWWSERADVIIVEGVGGILCPLTEETTVADLAQALDYPVLIVARRGLGTLNHTLLTVEAVRGRGLRIAGIVLNGAEPTRNAPAEATNASELARRLPGIAVLAEVPYVSETTLVPRPLLGLDWNARCGRSRLEWGRGTVGALYTEEASRHVERCH